MSFEGVSGIKEGDVTALAVAVAIFGIRKLASSAFVRKFFGGTGKRVVESTSRVKRKLLTSAERALFSASKVTVMSNPFALVSGLQFAPLRERKIKD